MKRYYFISTLIFLLAISSSYAQDSLAFKPSGKIIARSFFDYSKGFGEDDKSGFDITRALLGYNYKFTPTLQAQVVIDGAAGKTSSDGLEVYLRNAFVSWNDKGFNISAGLIGLMEFSVQETYWMHRYVMKSFQDLNKMGPSVDLGITAAYTFSPYLSADISLTNGEGNKKIKKDNSMRYAAGLSLYPMENTIFRIYGDIYNESEDLRDALPESVTDANYKNQYTLALFAGYQNARISFGTEYNRVFNKGFIEKKDYYGYSFYTSVKFAPKWRAFTRYDLVDSSTPDNFTAPWNSLDGQLMMIGIEFQPVKQLKIAPNFRNSNPDRSKSDQYLFVSVEFNL
ncbi:hypothetical protein D0T84_15140 [Dysgonomonas sp. 521]|uniref:hypothetical protein n=1 Tax=Dysgonomonas sp. 521 TaxID=2302932 RepID=UPI0013D1EFFB|nr:hypothetical protein [Dysgonomonas sp. 521]NDV96236.1 hypothetical protein [Dysgonomonas sp. 521]